MENSVLKKLKNENFQGQPQAVKSEKNHWIIQRGKDEILWLSLDKKDSSTNTLAADVLQELDEILQNVEQTPPRALIIRSAKKKGFCAGADIKEFKQYGESEMCSMLQDGHKMMNRLENLKIPTIAVIHGHCLGGGMELALACDIRIGIKGNLEMGLPEIRLGVHPGLGGTFRLTHLIDPLAAMKMMLTGKSAYEEQTKKAGLVDILVEQRHVKNAVQAVITDKQKKRRQSFKGFILNTGIARRQLAKKMRNMTTKKAPANHYPAPYALIELWEKHGSDKSKMQAAEMASFSKLLVSDTAQNLIRVFFLHQSLKNLARNKSDIQHVHVIGAGAMGGDIAGWCAMQGLHVTLSDQKIVPVTQAIRNTKKLCRDKHKSGIATQQTLDRLIPDMKNKGVETADLIIEAVPEDLEIKRNLYRSIEPQMKEGAILATNTSSTPLEQLAADLKNPARFIGLHFFNPVSHMKVVEIVRHSKIDETVLTDTLSFTSRIGKLPVPVKSHPGFLVNRALTPYLLEAIALLDEGVGKETIDQTAIDFGMPMGPIELADQVGLDICLHVADMLEHSLDKPLVPIPHWLRQKVDKGELGKKSGEGFYRWENGKAQKEHKDSVTTDKTMADRLILPMLNACAACLREGVVDNVDTLDAAMIFATGFAPFRGGPMHYAKDRGFDEIAKVLESFESEHGERFTPDPFWRKNNTG